jgi:hypothetical protein
VSFAAITLCVASQRVFVVVVSFFIDSVRKLLDTPSQTLHTRWVMFLSGDWQTGFVKGESRVQFSVRNTRE